MSAETSTTNVSVGSAVTTGPAQTIDDVVGMARRLRLPYLRAAASDVLATARAQRWDPRVRGVGATPERLRGGGVVIMAKRGRPGLSDEQKRHVWDRWAEGFSLSDIGRMLDKVPGSIHGVVAANGGIVPPQRHRACQQLTAAEREEISRGLARGASYRTIGSWLGRSASTVGREVARNGGRAQYRACPAEERAWDQALRPKRCLLAQDEELRDLVAEKLSWDSALPHL